MDEQKMERQIRLQQLLAQADQHCSRIPPEDYEHSLVIRAAFLINQGVEVREMKKTAESLRRFTKREGESAHFHKCFQEPCEGVSCQIQDCRLMTEVCDRLCELEDKLEQGMLKEPVHGRWSFHQVYSFCRRSTFSWHCSACGAESLAGGKEPYCYRCGALMDGKTREEG